MEDTTHLRVDVRDIDRLLNTIEHSPPAMQDVRDWSRSLAVCVRPTMEELARAQLAPDALTQARARIAELEARLRDAREIVVYAVARLDVLTFPGWPFEALRRLAGELKAHPDDDNTTTLAQIWMEFAAEAEDWENERKQGTHKIRLQQQNLMKSPVSLVKIANEAVQAAETGRKTRSVRKTGPKKGKKVGRKPRK